MKNREAFTILRVLQNLRSTEIDKINTLIKQNEGLLSSVKDLQDKMEDKSTKSLITSLVKKQDAFNKNFELLMPVVGSGAGFRFKYGVGKNIDILKNNLRAADEARVPGDDFKKYFEEVKKIEEKYALVDEKTKEPQKNVYGRFVVDPKRQEEFDSAHEGLKKEYKTAIDEQDKRDKEFQEFLEKEIDFSLYKIYIGDFPDSLNYQASEILMPIIREEE